MLVVFSLVLALALHVFGLVVELCVFIYFYQE